MEGEENIFHSNLEEHFSKNVESGALQKIKIKAWGHFLALGLPHKQTEAYKYIRLNNLYSTSFCMSQKTEIDLCKIANAIYPECRNSVFVFINGHYSPHLSNISALPQKMVITTLQEAAKTYSSLITNHWSKSLQEEKDPFVILNAALHRNGAFIYLPPGIEIESPIQLLHVIDSGDFSMHLVPRLHIFIGNRSKANFISTQMHLSGKKYYCNQVADFSIEDGANVKYFQINLDLPQLAWHFDAIRAHLKRDSKFTTVNVTNGCATIRNDYRITLAGENAEASLNGNWMLSEKREAHTHILMEHQKPHCRSRQLFKGVLDQFSRSSFEGKIYVHQAAQKTDAFQLNNNLLLSDRANADSKPNLEIFADDVKASHGATVGKLDMEDIFYLRSRGLSEHAAKNILIYGFCKEILDLIPIPSIAQTASVFAKECCRGSHEAKT